MRQAPRSPLSFKLQRVANVPEHPLPSTRLMSCTHIANRQLSRIIGARSKPRSYGRPHDRLVGYWAMTYAADKPTVVTGSGKVALPAYCMLALTLIGIAVAVYVARGNYTGQPLWCPIIDGCNVVVNSPYSRVFGVPMSYFGFIYYLYMFALAARLAFDPFSNSLRFRAVLYAGVGAASSMYFMYLQLGFIRAVCIYCLISAVTTFLLLIAAIWHFQATRHPPQET